MIVTIANQKGGVGRSTTAVLLSYAFARAGRKVSLLDVDPLGTSSSWIDEAYGEGKAPFQRFFWPKAELGKADETAEWDLEGTSRRLIDTGPPGHVLILDTGGRDAPGTQEAVGVADLVLLPTRPTSADAQETIWTLRKLKGPSAVMLAMAVRGSPEEKTYRQLLKSEGNYVLETVIPYDPDIAKLHEHEPEEGLYGYEELASELDSVMELLREAVDKRRQQEEWEEELGDSLFQGIDQRLSSPAYQRSS